MSLTEPADHDRLLVVIEDQALAAHLIRHGAALARALECSWVVLYSAPAEQPLAEPLAEAVRAAEHQGAETVALRGPLRSDGIREFAASCNGQMVMLMRGDNPRALARRLAARAPELTLIHPPMGGRVRRLLPRLPSAHPDLPQRFLLATLAVLASSLIAWPLNRWIPTANLSLIFLVGVLFAAVRLGRSAGIYAGAISFISFNFLFTYPHFTLWVEHTEDLLALGVFLLVALVVANLAARVQRQLETIRSGERRTRLLYDFSRRITGAVSGEDLAHSVAGYLAETLQGEAVVLLPQPLGPPEVVAGAPTGKETLTPPERQVALASLAEHRPAGRGTDIEAACGWYFVPLHSGRTALGVLGVTLPEGLSPNQEERRLLTAMRDQTALALERMHLVEERDRAARLSETERLRAALLSSVSHDLRTPLATIMGAASSLVELREALSPEESRELTEQVLTESERLNRFVQNLLDMTRLGHDAVRPRFDWCELKDIIAEATRQLRRPLAERELSVEVDRSFPLVFTDPTLLQQVLINLLENAARYSPEGSPIALYARRVVDELEIQVCDRGPGIDPAEREAVFDMFYRLRDAERRGDRTGLGLAICRGLVDALGGNIEARSREGGGTCIRVVLPQRRAQPEAAEERI